MIAPLQWAVMVADLYPAEALLPGGVAAQPHDSIVLAHQMRTISKDRLKGFLGHLHDPALRQQVQQAIQDHLDLD
jgi:mRNA interferase MazF